MWYAIIKWVTIEKKVYWQNGQIWRSVTSALLRDFSWNFHQTLLTIKSFYGQSSLGVAQWWLLLLPKKPQKNRFQEQAKIRPRPKFNIFLTSSSWRAFHNKVLCQFYSNSDQPNLWKSMMMNWIVFVVWMTNERRLALFPARTIVKDPHHHKSATRCKQDFVFLLF